MNRPQVRVPESMTHAIDRMLEEIIERARVPPEHIVAEAAKRGLPMSGTRTSDRLAGLRFCAPAQLDPLARQYITSSALIAGAQGFMANLGGAATLALSLPADTVATLAATVRATSGAMGSYGFETETEAGAAQLRVGLLVAAGVSMVTVEGANVLVSRLSQQLLQRAAAKRLEAALTGQISRRLATGLFWGYLPRAVPVVGGMIGGGVNAGLVRTMGGRARAHYRSLLVQWQRNRGFTPGVVWDLGEPR
ncbi:MAG: EcsC family protein [Egibacteraceae bacterium]